MAKRVLKSSGKTLSWLATYALALGALGSITGCGRTAFQGGTSQSITTAPGTFTVQPKVDILLATDDTGSMFAAYDSIATQFAGFLTTLQNTGWDYHFASVPLTTFNSVDQVLASRFDPGWGALWVAPFPGASPNSVTGAVAPWAFRTASNFSRFINFNDINNSLNGKEPGLKNVSDILNDVSVRSTAVSSSGSGLVRDDSVLVVITIGNGDDTSGITYCQQNGIYVPCESAVRNGLLHYRYSSNNNTAPYPPTDSRCANDPSCAFATHYYDLCSTPTQPCTGSLTSPPATSELSFNQLKSRILAARGGNASAVRQYSMTSTTQGVRSNCLGGNAYFGYRYQRMAAELGGRSWDVCSQSISSSLSALRSELQALKVSYRFRYLFIDSEPKPQTISVRKFVGGAGAGIVIPQDPINGWSYEGLTTVAQIDFPLPLNYRTGYAIRMNGTSALTGSDTATVTYIDMLTNNSVSK